MPTSVDPRTHRMLRMEQTAGADHPLSAIPRGTSESAMVNGQRDEDLPLGGEFAGAERRAKIS